MLSKKLLGNKENFAIEYEIESTYKQFMYGKICYWIQEKQIGKYDDGETLSDVLLFIPSIVRDNENRKHERFFELEMDKVIYLLSGAAFLEGNIEIEKKANEEQWARLIFLCLLIHLVIPMYFLLIRMKNRELFSWII